MKAAFNLELRRLTASSIHSPCRNPGGFFWLDCEDLPEPVSSSQSHRLVQSDPIEPCSERRVATKADFGLERVEKYILNEVFGIGMTTDDAITEPKKLPAILRVERLKIEFRFHPLSKQLVTYSVRIVGKGGSIPERWQKLALLALHSCTAQNSRNPAQKKPTAQFWAVGWRAVTCLICSWDLFGLEPLW
jgi:hypothetical protein